ncbi:MAG: RNA-dependent ATPase [Piccolia ochrophora]|nr:MAG: RNA-dependent ATPase [Piccolia ochrophora]
MRKRSADEADLDQDGPKQQNGSLHSKTLSKEERRRRKLEQREGREEKKRLRKLAKAEKTLEEDSKTPSRLEDSEVIHSQVPNGRPLNDISTEKDEAARTQAKAEQKAIKRAKKQARKDAKESSSSTSATPSNELSSAPSLAVSSATSPEPVPTPGPHRHSPYVEHPKLKATPQSEIDLFLSKNFITITDPQNPTSPLRPIISFDFLPETDKVPSSIFKSFSTPTAIQAAGWPYLLSGRDVIGVAETGSGKTLAFAVPCILHISRLQEKERGGGGGKRIKGVRAVIVSPTRELALQIHEQVEKLAGPAGLTSACLYGGVSKEEQRRALITATIIVATPGRLLDLVNEGAADLRKVSYLVLDEADRMLDKGFEEDIKTIISTTQPLPARQTLMFTATWPPAVRALASTFTTNPTRISIGDNNPSGDLRAATSITQEIEVIAPHLKETRLLELLREHQSGAQKFDRILVFCLYKKEATRIEHYLRGRGLRIAGIHGDYGQAQRTASLAGFKSGATPLLVATDVAARGLDIPAVKLVINCTFPLTVEDYVHRIGRTGRAGAPGHAITLFTEHDKAHSGALINVLRAARQPVPEALLKFGTTVKKKAHETYGAFYKDLEGAKTATKIKFDD